MTFETSPNIIYTCFNKQCITSGLTCGVVGGIKALAAGAVGSAGGGAASAGVRGISRLTRLLDNVDDAVGKRLYGLGDAIPQMRLGKWKILRIEEEEAKTKAAASCGLCYYF